MARALYVDSIVCATQDDPTGSDDLYLKTIAQFPQTLELGSISRGSVKPIRRRIDLDDGPGGWARGVELWERDVTGDDMIGSLDLRGYAENQDYNVGLGDGASYAIWFRVESTP
jgi:hypothetical protein